MKNRLNHNTRSGITLIEVLTSVAVATIGVLGVLVLIPLGSRFTEKGFDVQRARQLANNSFANFKAHGFLNHERWVFKQDISQTQLNAGFRRIALVGGGFLPGEDQNWGPGTQLGGLTGYCFDPEFIGAPQLPSRQPPIDAATNTQYGDNGLVRFFPYNDSNDPLVQMLRIPRVSVAPARDLLDARPMDFSLAADATGGDEFLGLQTNVDETQPPEQIVTQSLDSSGAAYPLKRDATWSMQTIGLLLPNASLGSVDGFNPPNTFRLVSLVIKDRPKFVGDYDRVFRVAMEDPNEAVNIDGGYGEILLKEEFSNSSVNDEPLKRGDWLIFFPYNDLTRRVSWADVSFHQVRNNGLHSSGGQLCTVVGPKYSAGRQGFKTLAVLVSGMVDHRTVNVQLNVTD